MQPAHEHQSIPVVPPGETRAPSAPFTCNILKDDADHHDSDSDDDGLVNQFPASCRIRENDELRAPRIPGPDLIARELDVKRLHSMIHLLWFAGRPVPPRPLHIQLSLGREIVIHELLEVHLVWGSGRIFLKPLPRYLLNPKFWADYLACSNSCTSTSYVDTGMSARAEEASPSSCAHQNLRACALGFLLSYVALITHESDFAIAKEKHLLPPEIKWRQWRLLVHEILTSTSGTTGRSSHQQGQGGGEGGGGSNALYTSQVAPRFVYGELRLNRLNLILWALHGPFSAGYLSTWQTYGSFLRANSDWIISATAYIIVVLSAMQVGLSTDALVGDRRFQDASYGFTVFSIIMPIVAVVGLVLVSVLLWGYNVVRTRRFEVQRSEVLGRTWRDEGRRAAKKRRKKTGGGLSGEFVA